MTEQQLDCAYVDTLLEQVYGKGMPKAVRANRFANVAQAAGLLAGHLHCLFADVTEFLAGK